MGAGRSVLRRWKRGGGDGKVLPLALRTLSPLSGARGGKSHKVIYVYKNALRTGSYYVWIVILTRFCVFGHVDVYFDMFIRT
jgi:hypothetical protein